MDAERFLTPSPFLGSVDADSLGVWRKRPTGNHLEAAAHQGTGPGGSPHGCLGVGPSQTETSASWHKK